MARGTASPAGRLGFVDAAPALCENVVHTVDTDSLRFTVQSALTLPSGRQLQSMCASCLTRCLAGFCRHAWVSVSVGRILGLDSLCMDVYMVYWRLFWQEYGFQPAFATCSVSDAATPWRQSDEPRWFASGVCPRLCYSSRAALVAPGCCTHRPKTRLGNFDLA